MSSCRLQDAKKIIFLKSLRAFHGERFSKKAGVLQQETMPASRG
ncbi:hypothetical protein ACFLT3_00205 [Chloroflexota bacterium]